MNDNDAKHDNDELPDWLWEIVEKHDLGMRTDNPCGGANVLLTDAGDLVQEIADTVFCEQAMTANTKQLLRKAIDMLNDAERLSAICWDEPRLGTVRIMADGIRIWAPDQFHSAVCRVAPSRHADRHLTVNRSAKLQCSRTRDRLTVTPSRRSLGAA